MEQIEKARMITIPSFNIILFCILLSIGCSQSKASKDDLITIELKKVIQNECDVPLSQFVESIEYIPL